MTDILTISVPMDSNAGSLDVEFSNETDELLKRT